MSLLSDYLLKEQQLKQLQEQLLKIEQDPRLATELEFKSKLESLMNEFGKSVADVVSIVDPNGGVANSTPVASVTTKAASSTATGTRRKRKLKIYKNPHTKEVIETRGGNHNVLKQWKEQYGAETVESWLESTRA